MEGKGRKDLSRGRRGNNATKQDVNAAAGMNADTSQSLNASSSLDSSNGSKVSDLHVSILRKKRRNPKFEKLIQMFEHIPDFERLLYPANEINWKKVAVDVQTWDYLKSLYLNLVVTVPRKAKLDEMVRACYDFQRVKSYRMALVDVLKSIGADLQTITLYTNYKDFGSLDVTTKDDSNAIIAEEIASLPLLRSERVHVDSESNYQTVEPVTNEDGSDVFLAEEIASPPPLPSEPANMDAESSYQTVEPVHSTPVVREKRNIREPNRFTPSIIGAKRRRYEKAAIADDGNMLGCCGVPYSESRNVVGCDKCNRWFHFTCAEFDIELPEDAEFHCKDCALQHSESSVDEEQSVAVTPSKSPAVNSFVIPSRSEISDALSASVMCPTLQPSEIHANIAETRASGSDTVDNTIAQPTKKSCIVVSSEPPDTINHDIAEIIGISDDNLNYKPPTEFEFEIPWDMVDKMINWETMKFVRYSWASDFDVAFKAVHVCGFNALRSPYIYEGYNGNPPEVFARINGKCKCGVEIAVLVINTPKKNHPLTCRGMASNNFKLVQNVNTGTRITGNQRAIMAAILKIEKPSRVQHRVTSTLDALRLAHNNHPQRSLSVLQKIRSEDHLANRLDKNLMIELQLLAIQFCKHEVTKQKLKSKQPPKVAGFIWDLKNFPFQFYIYSRPQIQATALLVHEADDETISFHVDSTGNISTKPDGERSKPLLTTLALKIGDLKPLVVAEMLSCSNTSRDISTFFERVFVDIRQFKNIPNPPLFVCDFSFAFIHGILKGVNAMKLDRYLDLCYEVFVGELERFPSIVSCVFLCTAHIMKAFLGNLCRKIKDKTIKTLAMFSMARLIEANNEQDYLTTLHGILSLFGSEKLPNEQNLTMLVDMMKQVDSVTADFCTGDEIGFELTFTTEELEKHTTQRARSKFYQHFLLAREQHVDDAENLYPNPYYEPAVIQVLNNDYIAYLPLWSRCVINKKRELQGFVRQTSGVVEGIFKDYKSNLHMNLPISASDFVRAHQEIVVGIAIERVMKAYQAGIIKTSPDKIALAEEEVVDLTEEQHAKESWQKRNPALHRKCSKYLSRKNAKQNALPLPQQDSTTVPSPNPTVEIDSDDDFDLSKSYPRRNKNSNNSLKIQIVMDDPIVVAQTQPDAIYFTELYDFLHGSKWMDCTLVNKLLELFTETYLANTTETVLLRYESCYFEGNIYDPLHTDWQITPLSFSKITPATKTIYHVWFIQNHFMLLRIDVTTRNNKIMLTSTLFNPLQTGDSVYDLCVMQGRPMLKNQIKEQLLTFTEVSERSPKFVYAQSNGDCPSQNDSINCSTACFRLLKFQLSQQAEEDLLDLWTENLPEYKLILFEMLLRSSPIGVNIMSAYDNNIEQVVQYFALAHASLNVAQKRNSKP